MSLSLGLLPLLLFMSRSLGLLSFLLFVSFSLSLLPFLLFVSFSLGLLLFGLFMSLSLGLFPLRFLMRLLLGVLALGLALLLLLDELCLPLLEVQGELGTRESRNLVGDTSEGVDAADDSGHPFGLVQIDGLEEIVVRHAKVAARPDEQSDVLHLPEWRIGVTDLRDEVWLDRVGQPER